ncbi:MAG: ComEC/Rec2 family competence protein [Pseudomonadota bacterium]
MQRFPLQADRFGEELQAPLGFAIGMIAGTVWYFSMTFEPTPSVVWGVALITMASLWACLRWQASRLAVLGLVLFCGAAFGAAAGSAATLRSQHATIQAPTGPVLLEGWITAAQTGRNGVRLVLKVHAIDGLDPAETPGRVRLTHILSLNTEPGRFVRCWAVLRPPPQPVIAGDYDFARQAWFSGLGAVGYVQGRCRGGALGPPETMLAGAALQVAKKRRRLARHVQQAAGVRAGGFAAALASGDRSFMPVTDQNALRASGLAHLLAISGLHMGIVGGLVFLFVWRGLALIEPVALRVPVKKPAAMAALLACAVYLVISGGSVSTQRAFIMSVVLFGAVLSDRTALSLRSLSIALIAILVLAPWSVLTPGFQMSFSATGALIATYEAWQKRQRRLGPANRKGVSFWLKSLVVTSTVSSLATMPFAMFHFDRIAALGIFANLIAMPIISLVSAPFAALALILAPLGGDGLALRAFGWSLEWVLTIAHGFASLGGEDRLSLPPMPSSSLALLSCAVMVYVTSVRGLVKAIGILALSGLAGAVWINSAQMRVHWAPSGEVFIEQASGEIERISILKGTGLPPLRFIDVRLDQTCAPRTVCTTTRAEMNLAFAPDDSSGGRLQITTRDASTDTIIDWADVVRENGVTLEWRGHHFMELNKPSCGRRAWRPCLSE